MKAKTLINGLFWVLTFGLFFFFLLSPPIYYGGDLTEYYGITESVINHGGINLTKQDQENLEKVINPVNFTDPQYYIKGKDGQRYPVHFIFYSILLIPIRLILKLFNLPEINTLRFGNLLIFSFVNYFILKKYLKDSSQKIIYLVTLYLSPLISFIIWPGPDVFYTSFIALTVFSFFEKNYLLAIFASSVSSWHSQPLMVISLAIITFYLLKNLRLHGFTSIGSLISSLGISFLAVLLMLLPYIYNYYLFGVLTPWSILADPRTQYYGFGFQNVSFKKLFEQFFDLNIGFFWYGPVLFLAGIYFLVKAIKADKKYLYIFLIFLITAFFYQTNPAWNYGTAGFGPTRHVIYTIPLLIYLLSKNLDLRKVTHNIILFLFVLIQLGTLSINGFLVPDFMATLDHSPYAKFILNNYSHLYSPTPEIFVDRTNHTDFKYPTSAFYKIDGLCKKAYVLKMDKQILENECGYIPEGYKQRLEDEFKQTKPYPRKIRTIEATLWCEARKCMQTIEDIFENTGVLDTTRWQKIDEYEGAWKFNWGQPKDLIVPPGYKVDYYTFEGEYVDYQ